MSIVPRAGFFVAVLFCAPATAAYAQADSMGQVKDHFAKCLHLPDAAAASRPTFYFSLTHQGEVVAHPRIVLFGFKGDDGARQRLIVDIDKAFAACLPLKLTREMSASLPGKVYFLQYAVNAEHRTTEVLFRPFGSHGGGGYAPLPLQPREDGFIPPNPPLELLPAPPRRETFGPSPPTPYFFLRPRIQRARRGR